MMFIRDRPFNLKEGGGGYVFLLRSEFFFRTTQELEYIIIIVAQSANFFSEFNIRLYDKNSESDYFIFPPPKSEYFFQQRWESEYFFKLENVLVSLHSLKTMGLLKNNGPRPLRGLGSIICKEWRVTRTFSYT